MVNSQKYISHENKEIPSTCYKSEHIFEFLNPHFENISQGFYPSKHNSKVVYTPNPSKNWNTVPAAWHYTCWSQGLCSALEMPRPGNRLLSSWLTSFQNKSYLILLLQMAVWLVRLLFKKFGRWHLAHEMVTSLTAEEEEVPYRGTSSQ